MLQKTSKQKYKLKYTSLYRTLFGVIVMLCASSSAQSYDLKGNYSYLNCSITGRSSVDNYKGSFEDNQSFRLDEKNKELSYYNEMSNKYTNLCDSDCRITDNYIIFKDKTYSYISKSYTINRWNGDIKGYSTMLIGKYRSDGTMTGDCQSGVSRLKTKPRF